MFDYKTYLSKLEKRVIAKVDTKKRRILLYDNVILVFKKFGYSVVLEMFIRIRDIQKYSYISSTDNNNSLEIKLVQRPNITKRSLIIPFKYPSSAFAVNNFICRLNEILEEMNPKNKPVYLDWEDDDPLYSYEDDDPLYPYDDDSPYPYDDDNYEPNSYNFPDQELEDELKKILQDKEGWIDYIEQLPADSPLRTNNTFIYCNGDVRTVLNTGIEYYNLGSDNYYAAAFECFRLVASTGNIRAALYLGKSFLYGHGTDKNLEYALHWLCIAANQYNSAYPLIHECCQQLYGNKE